MAATKQVRIGVAGWDYPDWKGILYPARKPRGFDPVRFLARFLDVVEIDSTFFHPARGEIAQRWARRVEDLQDFRYTAKLWRRFTHERKSTWTRADIKAVTDGFDVLHRAGKLDAMVIHLPWSFRNDVPSRKWLAELLATFEQYPRVVEVRHASWNVREFHEWLSARGVGFVNVDQPQASNSIAPVTTAVHTGYVRVHGRNYSDWFRQGAGRDARYNYTYAQQELESWAERTDRIASNPAAEKVDVIFNNHYKAKAVVNAIQFKHLLTGDRQPAPPMLFSHYSDVLVDHAFPADEAGALVT